jgi:hypothetical protein
VAALLHGGAAIAQDQNPTTRQLVLQGAFAAALESAGEASGSAAPASLFDQGLAAYALKDFERAAGLFAQVAQSNADAGLIIRAAVAATLALSNTGDRSATCDYAGIVAPLVQDMPLLWRGWMEETRRRNNCS